MEPKNTVETIARNIGYYMVDSGKTREQVAKELHISSNTLRAKMDGSSEWQWSELLALAQITKKSPNELTGFTAK